MESGEYQKKYRQFQRLPVGIGYPGCGATG